jgi:hypothetical protein
MTNVDAIRARHVATEFDFCNECRDLWPCDTQQSQDAVAAALAAHDALKGDG